MNIYCPEPLPSCEINPFFTFRYRAPSSGRLFNEHLPENFFEREVVCADVTDARAIVLPNNFKQVTPEINAYVRRWADEGERLRIPVFVFSLGDLTDRVRFDPRVRVFRYSVYRHAMNPRDIVMPTMIDDIGHRGIALRQKNERPMVSFCGQAGFRTRAQWIKYAIKSMYYALAGIANPPLRARMLGIYWRRAAMRACRRSALVEHLFIVRRSFSGIARTIELESSRARREFIESIADADFVLAPKGDGNYSNRFLEALSLGRIPVLIDTDVVLPFEDSIDYEKIIVRVPMQDVRDTPRYIRAFYDPLSPQEWEARQHLARETFEKYLRQDAFFREFFSRESSLCPQS